jgi:hypothetical protein
MAMKQSVALVEFWVEASMEVAEALSSERLREGFRETMLLAGTSYGATPRRHQMHAARRRVQSARRGCSQHPSRSLADFAEAPPRAHTTLVSATHVAH